MKKKEYKLPMINIVGVCALNILEDTNETLPFDPGDETGEVLGKYRDPQIEYVSENDDEWKIDWNLW